MAKKKQAPEEQMGGAPEWITTFVDMISLLVTFFILLLTFSSMEDRTVLKLKSWLKRNEGILESTQRELIRETPDQDWISATDPLRGGDEPHSRPPEELVENLEEMGQRDTPDHTPLDLNEISDGLRITWDERCAFAPGSATPSPELQKSLVELGRTLQHYGLLAVVEGHTDDAFAGTLAHPDATSLSLARARAAAEVMLSASELSPELIQIAGLGADRPRAENDTPRGRQANRRVEVRIHSLSKLRTQRLRLQRHSGEEY